MRPAYSVQGGNLRAVALQIADSAKRYPLGFREDLPNPRRRRRRVSRAPIHESAKYRMLWWLTWAWQG